MPTFDEKYLDSYKKIIAETKSIEELQQYLPNDCFSGYTELMNNLLSFIDSEIQSLDILITETKDESDILDMRKEHKLLEEKKELISRMLNKKEEEDKEELDAINSKDKRNLVFLKSSAGNVLFERDIKDFPKEYKSDLGNLLEKLENYSISFDDSEEKKMAGVNAGDLRGVFEVKGFKTRVFFQYMDKSTVLVVMAGFKNQERSKKLTESVIIRISQSQKIIRNLRDELKDSVTRAQIIDENKVIKELIMNSINSIEGNDYEK